MNFGLKVMHAMLTSSKEAQRTSTLQDVMQHASLRIDQGRPTPFNHPDFHIMQSILTDYTTGTVRKKREKRKQGQHCYSH